MTNKAICLVVALEKETREDDLQDLMMAIEMLKGVIAVTMDPVDPAIYSIQEKLRWDMWDKVRAAFWGEQDEA